MAVLALACRSRARTGGFRSRVYASATQSVHAGLLTLSEHDRVPGEFYAASKDSEVSPVDIRDIAALAVAVLTGSDHEGKKYVITGPEALTYSAVAEKLSEAIGKKVSYVDVPLATAKKTLLDGGAPEWKARRSSSGFGGRANNRV